MKLRTYIFISVHWCAALWFVASLLEQPLSKDPLYLLVSGIETAILGTIAFLGFGYSLYLLVSTDRKIKRLR